jgi:uncharacterized protein (DUF885 family)
MVIRFTVTALVVAIVLSGCTKDGADLTTRSSPSSLTDSTTTRAPEDLEALGFDAYVEEAFTLLVSRSPQTVTEFGLAKEFGMRDDRLDDLSESFADETYQQQVEVLDQLGTFSAGSLTEAQIVTKSSFEWYLEKQIDLYPFRLHVWPVHFLLTSYNQGLLGFFTEVHPVTNRNQADDYITRIGSIDEQVASVIENMNRAVDMGVFPPTYVLDTTIDQLASDLGGGDPRRTAIFSSFESRVGQLGLNRATVADYLERAERAIEDSFLPAWETLIEYLGEVRPSTTNDVGVGRLPDGAGFYQALLGYHTSTELTAAEIHEIGWRQVNRITREMLSLGATLGHPDSTIGELREVAATEGGFLSGEAVVAVYHDIIEGAYNDFGPYFHREPQEQVNVVTDLGPVSFYVGPAADGSRQGSFHAATGGGSVPAYTMRSLAYHEAVPGHHFQVALAQELDLPSPQRFWTNTGQVEGWALYAERLAFDIGLYDNDPISNFGRLDFELLRAARLVVDTGIHHLGWSRDEAIAMMTDIMDGPQYNGEVDRYVLYPGQATAYMVGMLAIIHLRDSSGVDPEDRNAMAEFHDIIIGSGNVPLSVIQDLVSSAGG